MATYQNLQLSTRMCLFLVKMHFKVRSQTENVKSYSEYAFCFDDDFFFFCCICLFVDRATLKNSQHYSHKQINVGKNSENKLKWFSISRYCHKRDLFFFLSASLSHVTFLWLIVYMRLTNTWVCASKMKCAGITLTSVGDESVIISHQPQRTKNLHH